MTRDDLLYGTSIGDVPGPDVRAVLELAVAIHYAESTDRSVDASWSAQERAREFFNKHGLAATFDEARRLEALALPKATA